MKVVKKIISEYALMLLVPIVGFAALCLIFPGVIGMKNVTSF